MNESASSKIDKRNKLYQPPPKEDYSKKFSKLIIVIIISFAFIAGQFIGGYISKSISVISDAFHLVTDLIGFVISYVFIYYSRKQPTHKISFGYHRMQVLGALGNLFIIWALALFLIYEATDRIITKTWVKQPTVMLIVAGAGLPVNIIMFFVLHSGSSHSHGLMSENCGEEFQQDGIDEFEMGTSCSEMLCEDIECLTNQQYEDHCHVKNGTSEEIHRHGKRVTVEENKIVRQKKVNTESLKEPQENMKADLVQKKRKKSEGSNLIQDHDHNHNHNHAHHHESMSMKAAVLHALSDVIQSIGLLISSLIIFFLGSQMGSQVTQWNNWHYFDPISTYIFSVIVILSTFPIAKNCYYIIMEATPTGMSVTEVKNELSNIPGAIQVHNIHLWDLRPGKTILIAHVVSEKNKERKVLRRMTDYCRRKKIYHSTIQVEEFQLKNDEEYIQCEHGFN